MSKTVMDKWLERVRKAMELSTAELKCPRSEYITALDELGADIEAMEEAAREEALREDVE